VEWEAAYTGSLSKCFSSFVVARFFSTMTREFEASRFQAQNLRPIYAKRAATNSHLSSSDYIDRILSVKR